MNIYYNDTVLEIAVNDNSYRCRAIMGDNNLTLYYSLPEHVEIPLGAWCEFQGERYTLESPENFKKHGTRNFEYTLLMESAQSSLRKIKVVNLIDNRLKFSLTARPEEHLAVVVGNLNRGDSGWSIGECIQSTEKPIQYNTTSCDGALRQIAEAFNTEWHIIGKSICLGKVEYNKDNPLALSYGKGKGFVPGVGRTNFDKSSPVEVLYVQGGTKNIDFSTYGSHELLLPKNTTFSYDNQNYITDAYGYSVHRADVSPKTGVEDALDLSHIYPSWEHVVTKVSGENEDSKWDIFAENTGAYPDNTPDGLDYNEYRIKGEMATIIFQSGELAGKEFELVQTDKALTGYVHAERKFMLRSQDIDGQRMPNEKHRPQEGHRFKVFGVSMPDAYIVKAEKEMLQEAVKYLYEHETPRFSFTGELDGIWAKKDWDNIGGKIKLGGYISFSDEQFQREGIAIRIVGIKDFVNNPHSPQIELSNSVNGGSIYSNLDKIEGNEVVIDDRYNQSLQFTKRRFGDAKETIKMLEEALLGFSDSIDPITIRTMQLLVGDESLQFKFVNNITNPKPIRHDITYSDTAKQLTAQSGILQHLTLGVNSITSVRKASDYFYWTLPEFTSGVLDDPKQSYYLYAKVGKSTKTGVFELLPKAVEMDGGSDYYLLCGILNSERQGSRSYVSMHGFTEILPGQITTDRIVSSNGECFFDFDAAAFRVGNSDTSSLSWNINNDNRLVLRGTMVQNPAGEESVMGCWRGEWLETTLYYLGDEVTYSGASFRCIQNCTQVGVLPVNTSFWKQIAAKGTDGKPGEDGKPGADGLTGNLINGSKVPWYAPSVGESKLWNDPENYIIAGHTYTLVVSVYSASNTYTFAVSGESGRQLIKNIGGNSGDNYTDKITFMATVSGALQCTLNQKGTTPKVNWVKLVQGSTSSLEHEYSLADLGIQASRVPMFRGDFDTVASRLFYNNSYRQDCVLYSGLYYRYVGVDGQAHTYWSAPDWEPFGATFESVATGTMLAENANLAGFIFSKGVLRSAETVTPGGQPRITLNGKTGEAKFNEVEIRGIVNATEGAFGDLRIAGNSDLSLVDQYNNEIVKLIKGNIPSCEELLKNNQQEKGTFPAIPSFNYGWQPVYDTGAVGRLTTSTVIKVSYADTTITVTGIARMNTVTNNPSTDGSIIEMSVYLKNSSNGRQWLLGTYTCSCGVFNNGQGQKSIEPSYSTKLHSMPSGNYYIEAEHKLLQQQGAYYINDVGLFSGTITAMRVNATNQSIFGRGAAVVFDSNNYLHYGYDKTSGGKIGLTYRGPLDMPGILASYTITKDGIVNTNCSYGAKMSNTSVGHPSTGKYTIPHNIGSSGYTVQVTLSGVVFGFVRVITKSAYDVTIEIVNHQNSAFIDSAFEITFIGNN